MAFIVHLCVAPEHRRKKVAKALNESLVETTKHLRGIQLRCRRDYPANDMWPKLGYRIVDEVPGRGKDAMPLAVWRIDHGHADLFSELDKGAQVGNALRVAIDTNIFLDLDGENESPDAESLPLKADWLKEAVEFFLGICVLPVTFTIFFDSSGVEFGETSEHWKVDEIIPRLTIICVSSHSRLIL